jgi:hypothetical protein
MPGTLPEVLPFPLYHGTSTTWRESIVAYGFGGRQPVEKLRAADFCQAPVTQLDYSRVRTRGVRRPRGESYRPSGDHTLPGTTFAMAAGCIRLAWRSTALKYAVGNPFGSEILTECYRLYKLIVPR